MFRFFRSIRRSLLNENKTFKYLKYAVGEVLLVVIGILIALSVNNWNEGQKLELERQGLIENLKIEFEENLSLLNRSIPVAVDRNEKVDLFLSLTNSDNSHLTVDELKLWAREAYLDFRFQPVLATYEAAVSTGEMGLIKSPKLQKLIAQFLQNNRFFQQRGELAAQAALLGIGQSIRDQLGSWGVLLEGYDYYTPPDAFKLADQEYRLFIARKEVYSAFENMKSFHANRLKALNSMKETTEEILVALEAL